MKNIHLIPTDKPSRLFEILQFNFIFDNQNKYSEEYKKLHKYKNKSIYITSDEEIKEGDWFYDLDTKYIKVKQSWENSHLGFNSKKIILTTDQDLIKDGVQAIDDEFLEWFVKNPSCEGVEVKLENYYASGALQPNLWQHKIIIPKEEPKHETVEEASWKFNPLKKLDGEFIRAAFIAGAKWQAERMYSEKEMLAIIAEIFHTPKLRDGGWEDIFEWFEQFKK